MKECLPEKTELAPFDGCHNRRIGFVLKFNRYNNITEFAASAPQYI
jgi:hypothetical protein